MKSAHIQHLYNRIGFGITPQELKRLSKKNKKKVVEELFTSSKNTNKINVDISYLKSINYKDLKNKEKRRELQKMSRKKITEFSIACSVATRCIL